MYAFESRRWEKLFLSNKRYPPYQVQQFQDHPDKERHQRQKKTKKEKKTIVKEEKGTKNIEIKIKEQKNSQPTYHLLRSDT